MRIAALIVSALALATLTGGVKLLIATHRFAASEQYALGQYSNAAYAVRHVEADGSGLYAPGLLVIALGLFLAKFAYNLWVAKPLPPRAKRPRSRRP